MATDAANKASLTTAGHSHEAALSPVTRYWRICGCSATEIKVYKVANPATTRERVKLVQYVSSCQREVMVAEMRYWRCATRSSSTSVARRADAHAYR